MSTLTDDDLASQRARTEAIGRAGRRWVVSKSSDLEQLPAGTVVIFDVETGEYVTGATHIEAMDKFDKSIGAERPSFIHEVKRRVFLGGGLLG